VRKALFHETTGRRATNGTALFFSWVRFGV
jgi:hypothetical protein